MPPLPDVPEERLRGGVRSLKDMINGGNDDDTLVVLLGMR
jgi:hypothetical protein